MSKRFKTVLTTYEDGKLLHTFTSPSDSAQEAVLWVSEKALLDAAWADERARTKPRYDERIVVGATVRHNSPTWGSDLAGEVIKIHTNGLPRATVKFPYAWRASVVNLANLEFVSAPTEEKS